MTCYWSRLLKKDHSDHSVVIEPILSIDQVKKEDWDPIVQDRNLFLSRGFLSALESSRTPCCHVVFRQENRAVGVASFQTAKFYASALTSYLRFQCAAAAFAKLQISGPNPQRVASSCLSVVVCGSPFVSGEYGYAFLPKVNKELASTALLLAAKKAKVYLDEKADRLSSAVLIKEFSPSSRDILEGLTRCRFSEIATDPAMVLSIDPTWRTFKDYQDVLSSKYRINANRAYSKSREVVEMGLSSDDIAAHRERIASLYRSVVDKARTRLGELDVDTVVELKRRLEDALIVNGYFLSNRLVGFLMGFVNGDSLEAAFVGFDDGINRLHSVYPRMLYDYLKIAISRGLKRVNYGRTASEIKSTLGAIPVDMPCCLMLDGKLLNAALPLFTGAIRPEPFSLRRPFKREWYELSASGAVKNESTSTERSILRNRTRRPVDISREALL